MPESYYLIDSQLSVRPLVSYLSRKGTWWDRDISFDWPDKGEVVGNASGPAFPITPDGELRPGELYESSADPRVRFYLPEYRLNVVNGSYSTRLKWRDEHDDPNGPLAFLTLEIVAVTPSVSGSTFTLQEIPHQVAGRIVYQMPIENGVAQLGIEVGALGLVGDGIRRGRLPISDKRDFDRLYQVMTDSSFNARLEIRCFATAERRTWRQLVFQPIDLDIQRLVLKERRILCTDIIDQRDLQVLEPIGHGSNIHEIVPHTEFIGNMRWDDAVDIAETSVIKLAEEVGGEPILSSATDSNTAATITVIKDKHDGLFAVIAGLNIEKSQPFNFGDFHAVVDIPLAEPPVMAPQPFDNDLILTDNSPIVGSIQPVDTALAELVVKPVLKRAFARPLVNNLEDSDIWTWIGGRYLKAVPLTVFVDEDARPALMQIQVESTQIVAPFWFLVDTNAYMFDIPGDMHPDTHHILIRAEVRDGTGQVVGIFYQDSAYEDLFYYQPQEFRVPRLDIPPYLPDLRIVFFEMVTQDTSGDTSGASGNGEVKTTLNYKVRLAYRALPHMEPYVLDLAQQQWSNVQARFVALAPESTRLSLRIPEDETGGTLTDTERPGIEVRFDQGIVDEIELSATEFERIFTYFQSPNGVGIDGEVEADLLGSMVARVPVRLSLKQTTGSVFGHSYQGPLGNGMHAVRLINRIESPVTIDALYTVIVSAGVFAYPQAAPGQTVQPGEELTIQYLVTEPGVTLNEISPALSASIDLDPYQLWPQLFINQGYASQTFPIHLTIAAGFFGVTPPGTSEPLTGVKIDFDDGNSATLTALRLEADVRLRYPLLPWLLGGAEAAKYRYRITNLLGADAHASALSVWIDGVGDLQVQPVGA